VVAYCCLLPLVHDGMAAKFFPGVLKMKQAAAYREEGWARRRGQPAWNYEEPSKYFRGRRNRARSLGMIEAMEAYLPSRQSVRRPRVAGPP